MLKKSILIVIACIFIWNKSYSQTDTALVNAYQDLVNGKEGAEMAYFAAFPVTFMQFYETMLNPAKDRLFCEKHLAAFRNKLSNVPVAAYYKRLVTLSITGIWSGFRCVTYLQDLIHYYTEKNPQQMLKSLSTFSRGYQLRFWQFYWSSPNTTDVYQNEYVKLRGIMYPLSPEQTKIMDIAFDFAYREIEVREYERDGIF
ncbi:MAG: hypothetical protein LBG92_09570 [Prevotellaceae bacterium]|jgi:hypothetical protein|nr:hypothetical protein [Prevotellaceae bacterium]